MPVWCETVGTCWTHWLALTMLLSTVRSEMLFRVTPGGDGIRDAGLWGGHIDLTQNGQANDLYSHGYQDLNTSATSYHGIEIEYVSHDPVSKATLMVIEDPSALPSSTKQAISLGYMCQENQATLNATFQNFQLIDNSNPYLMDSDCGWKCGWGPFALYNNHLYFILSAVFGPNFSDLTRQIQLRVLDGCEDVIDSMRNQNNSDQINYFLVLECSQVVETIYSEVYTKPSPRPKAWVATELKVINKVTEDSGDSELHFFTQLVNTYLAEPYLHLIHIDRNTTATIAKSPINSIYTTSLRIRGFGAVDFKDGILCWTSGDVLQCGLYDLDGQQTYVVPLLGPDHGSIEDICTTGSFEYFILLNGQRLVRLFISKIAKIMLLI